MYIHDNFKPDIWSDMIFFVKAAKASSFVTNSQGNEIPSYRALARNRIIYVQQFMREKKKNVLIINDNYLSAVLL